MDPREFSWSEDQQVTVTNPTAETYKFKVHSKEYELEAGKSAKMPGYIAWVYVYGMAVKLVQADGFFNRWNEEGFRQEYYEKVVSGVDPLIEDVAVDPQPLVQTLDEPANEDEQDPDPAEPTPEPKTPAEPELEPEPAGEEVKKTPVPDYSQVKPMESKTKAKA